MKPSIVVLNPGPGEGRVIPINAKQFMIGRDPGCHLRPACTHINKRHCALLLREDKVFLQDFGSNNGTFVNDRQIRASEIELHDGDRIRVGQLFFTIRSEPEVVTSPTQPRPHKVMVQNGRGSQAAIPPAEEPVCSAGSEEGAAATLPAMQERGVPDAGQPTEARDGTTTSDASFATLAETETPKPVSGDPSIAPAAVVRDEDDTRTTVQQDAGAKQTAAVQAPGMKLLRFLLGILVGFVVTAFAMSVWVLSLVTVVDWFRGENWFSSRFPSPFPLWLAVVLTLVVPLLTLCLILYIRKFRIRSR